jgi:PAS domain S-box-containing protein
VIAKDKEQIRILHVEDDPNDGELISIAIRRRFPKCVINRISSRVEFEQALHRDFDVILSDFKIPNFSGREALELPSERRPEVPFIFISGTIGEMAAVESLKMGATDYILKDAPQRLIPAIERALKDADSRRKQKATELALAESEARFRTLVERALVGIYLIQEGRFIYANPALSLILGYSNEELCSLPLLTFIAPEDHQTVKSNVQSRLSGQINAIRYDVRLKRKDGAVLQAEIRPVLGNETEIFQVLMNLCVNARDAMPKDGQIQISAENRCLDESEAKGILGASAGEYSVITVADNGSGIAPEIIEKIFDPFFSTKGVGEGTGLGLSTTVKILKNHNGFLTVSSEVGVGTTFSVFLPSIPTTSRL